jgi:antagonist of KipI
MSIKILKAGISATVQDAGRTGFRSIGVGSAGAMDFFAMKVSNYLCGNEKDEAVIEINFPAPEILFEQDAIASITGADFSAILEGKTVLPWRTFLVRKGAILKFEQPVSGARAYLAVAGGWQADQWLGSCSTHGKLGVGGHAGRALQKDDIIHFPPVNRAFNENKILPWFIPGAELDKIYRPSTKIRCIPGPENSLLTEPMKRNLEQQDFIISLQSDRMGYRFKNKPLLADGPFDLLSSPVDMGTVQLLPDGTIIILMADHQTTGGYPRVAAVIKADLPKLAQASPGQSLNFIMVSVAEAEARYTDMLRSLEEIKRACHLNLKNMLARD